MRGICGVEGKRLTIEGEVCEESMVEGKRLTVKGEVCEESMR